jgi:hypothetical protein
MGELYFIRKFLPEVNGGELINAWRGPIGAKHDFQWEKGAIEIKASTVDNPLFLTISNENQLDSEGIELLYVWFLSLSIHKSGRYSLPSLIQEISETLDEEYRDRFYDRLASTGYSDEDKTEYEEDRYIFQFSELYEVDDSFPKLTPKNLPASVSAVSYSIDRSACISSVRDAKLITKIFNEG